MGRDMRDSFIFYRSFADAIKELEPNDRSALVDILMSYALDDVEPDCTGPVKGMFLLIKPQIDANNRRYENGKKGGRPKNQDVTKHKPNINQTQTNLIPNVNDNVKVNDNDNDNVNENTTFKRSEEAEKYLSELRKKIKEAKYR